MPKIVIVYIALVVAMAIMDVLWVGGIAKPFYQKHLGYLFAEKFKVFPIIVFYLLYILGVMVLVISPALSGTIPLGRAVLMGGLFGLVAYGTYDLTSHGLIRDWPGIVTFVDMLWGTFLTALIAAIGIALGRLIA